MLVYSPVSRALSRPHHHARPRTSYPHLCQLSSSSSLNPTTRAFKEISSLSRHRPSSTIPSIRISFPTPFCSFYPPLRLIISHFLPSFYCPPSPPRTPPQPPLIPLPVLHPYSASTITAHSSFFASLLPFSSRSLMRTMSYQSLQPLPCSHKSPTLLRIVMPIHPFGHPSPSHLAQPSPPLPLIFHFMPAPHPQSPSNHTSSVS